MKKLYKYLAVAACALLGVGSATAAPITDTPYFCYNNGSGWSFNTPMESEGNYVYSITIDLNKNAYVKISTNGSSNIWDTVNQNAYGPGSDTSIDNFVNKSTTVSKGASGAIYTTDSNAGTYTFKIDLSDSGNVKLTIFEEAPITAVPFFHYSDETGNNWDVNHAMAATGSYVYTETRDFKAGCYFKISTSNDTNNDRAALNANAYGVAKEGTDVLAEDYLGQTTTITKGNDASFKITVEATYIVTVDFSDQNNPNITITRNGGTGSDITLDDHGTTYATTPQLTDLMLAYWVGTQTSHSDSHKYIVFNDYAQGSLSGTKFGWAKYEDTSDYESWMTEAGDTEAITENETAEHDCRNFNDAYYRFYVYNLNSRPDLKNAPVQTTGVRTPRAVPAQSIEHSRVARTFPMKDNTTGVDDIETDGGTSVEDTNAPVIWYNL